MFGQIVARAHPAQVDHPLQPDPVGGHTEVRGSDVIAIGESGGSVHRVDEVVRDLTAVERGVQARRLQDVARHDLDPVSPGIVLEFPRIADHAPDLVAGVEQSRYEPATDVFGCIGHEDPHGLASHEVGGGRRHPFYDTLGSRGWIVGRRSIT